MKILCTFLACTTHKLLQHTYTAHSNQPNTVESRQQIVLAPCTTHRARFATNLASSSKWRVLPRVEPRSHVMEKLSDAPCIHCKVISPHHGKNSSGHISIPYNRVDQYPNFPALEVSAGTGCAFCRLLKYALQDKYSDRKIAEAEADFDPSIRAQWPKAGWNGQVTVDGARFFSEEDWNERDESQELGQSLGGVWALSFRVWPYPPRRNFTDPGFNHDSVWFAPYADSGKWTIGVMFGLLILCRL